ncbi:MAG TPA: protein phosphatase 2C domain-containing protein [Pedobacter sp.]|uniref:PP2C family protein-serine/threonine phosphatase n=1 Tax=Pedobacter sp. TaxID=1411316 RepID=UPI002BB61252|nr:protein phosphatase 2C domain-containing protein [Pedobacter sp.]HMI01527.1 protein phosphatase 2C domain-containing protein [Pedobacter sp.]
MDRNYFGITDTGKVRDNNEDTFIAEKTSGNDLIIASVIDGVGGYSGGEIASAIARRSILQHLNLPNADVPALMKDAIIDADTQIMAEKLKVKDHEKMACVLTLAVADLSRNLFHYAHVGDTRLYLLRDGTLIKITKDQSFVGFMEDTGRLTEEQAMRHPKRNEINKALGFGINIAGQDDYIELGQSPFLPGDTLLICSDGLSDMVNKQEITAILTSRSASLQEKGEQLIAAANKNGGLDNITVVLVKNDKQAQAHEAPKPAAKKAVEPVVVPHSAHDRQPASASVKSPVKNPDPVPDQHVVPVRTNKGLVGFLIVLCLSLLAVNAWLLWQNHVNEKASTDQLKLNAIKPPRNVQEKKLQDTLNKLKGNMLILTDSLFKSPILITEPLQINRDTLYLIAQNGMVIKRDTSFSEIPIAIKPASKHVLLENFTFEDFNTVISSQNNALVFKNVKFINSPNAIQIIYNFPAGKYINGKIPRSTFKTDSLPLPVNN